MNAGLILFAVFAASAFDQVFDQGVAAYDRGEYPASINSFEQLVSEGVVQKEVFYNLGNAYFRNGQVAPAIANYERAWRLDPGEAVVRENLDRAVGQTERGMSRPQPPGWEQGLFFWHAALTTGESLAVAVCAWTFAWLLLILRSARPLPYLRGAAAVSFVVAAAFAASWWIKNNPPQLAVAAEARVPVRYGSRPEETVRFELYEGDRVRIEEIKNGWARVRTADGERGWTEETRLHLVGPPYLAYGAQAQAPAADRTASQSSPESTGYGRAESHATTDTVESRP